MTKVETTERHIKYRTDKGADYSPCQQVSIGLSLIVKRLGEEALMKTHFIMPAQSRMVR